MNRPADLRSYSIKKIIDWDDVAMVDYSGVNFEKGKFVVSFTLNCGEKLTVDFPNEHEMNHAITGITNAQIKLCATK